MDNYSLRTLGSNELSLQLRKDVKELIGIAAEQQVKPVMFIVGKLFVDVLVARLLRKNLNLYDSWTQEMDNHSLEISNLYKEEQYKAYCECEDNEGSVALGEDKQPAEFPVFFDPDEEYMCLIVADPTVKAKQGEFQTADGHPYYFLKYKPEEILTDFSNNLKI